MEPGQALDALLRAVGVPAEHIPPGAEQRAGLYRSVLAKSSEPLLLIADNASSESQVRPLIPGSGRHRVLVTSRNILAGLGARLVPVKVLDDRTSVVLLDTALRTFRPADDRISSDPSKAVEMARACGGLPLALLITADILKADPSLTTGEMADALAVESARLERLAYDDGTGADGQSVEAAFRLSYRRLKKIPKRVFRLLPLNPGPDVSTSTAAALVDLPVSRTRDVLAGLARAHLTESIGSGAGVRWRMHDLLRLYAQRLSDRNAVADGRDQARDRLLGYYLDMATAADSHMRALPGTTVPQEFAGRDDAMAWLDAERPNLVAIVRMAADTGRVQSALRFPLVLGEYFDRHRRFDDWLATSAIGLSAARRVGDRNGESASLSNFGRALYGVGEFKDAVVAHLDASAICREVGNLHDEGVALNNAGQALQGLRRFKVAVTMHQWAVTIYRQTGDQRREGGALANLSNALRFDGQFREAIAASREAVRVFREIGDRPGGGMALGNLGLALRNVNLPHQAITAHQDAIAIFREGGDRHREAMELGNLGLALREVQRFEDAIAVFREAAAIFRATEDRSGEGMALVNLSVSLREHAKGSVQQVEEAITACREGAMILRDIGNWYGEGSALHNLGLAFRDMQQFEEAIVAFRDAAAIFGRNGDQRSERIALESIKTVQSAQAAQQL